MPTLPGAFGAFVVTARAEAVHAARAEAVGAEVIIELHETDYGSRDFAVRDAEGDRWSFGPTPGSIVAAPPSEAGALSGRARVSGRRWEHAHHGMVPKNTRRT
ncbi:VOC family protein [Kitasatospora aureofaciens]|uniref:hypothetical protein n=1 Tax=Kitasatospora aureofaciens TaxID=1894 RepID=UPI0036F453C2